MTLAIFDLCDTLYSVNTTNGFVDYHLARTGNDAERRRVREWSDRSSLWFYVGALSDRLVGRDIARTAAVAALAGQDEKELRNSARDYTRDVLSTCCNRTVIERLQTHKANGDSVMIATSSLDLVAAAVGDLLGVDWIASTTSFDADRKFRGIELDLTGRKLSATSQRRAGARRVVVYSDNRSDLPLLRTADEAVVVVPVGKRVPSWAPDGAQIVQL